MAVISATILSTYKFANINAALQHGKLLFTNLYCSYELQQNGVRNYMMYEVSAINLPIRFTLLTE
jgi:hypothetical protein